MSFVINLYRRFERLAHELAKFGSVGAIAFVITFAAGNLLYTGLGMGPLTSNGIASVISTTFAYFANRHWTFRHRDRTGLRREYVLFFGLNGIGMVIAELFIGFTHYVLDQQGKIAYNCALIVGTGVGTLFRFWSYKKWVFLPTAAPADPAATAAEMSAGRPAGAHVPPGHAARPRIGAVNGSRPSAGHRAEHRPATEPAASESR